MESVPALFEYLCSSDMKKNCYKVVDLPSPNVDSTTLAFESCRYHSAMLSW